MKCCLYVARICCLYDSRSKKTKLAAREVFWKQLIMDHRGGTESYWITQLKYPQLAEVSKQ